MAAIWVTFLLWSMALAVLGLLLSVPVAGALGLIGHLIGLSLSSVQWIGTTVGVAIYAAGTMFAMKRALQRQYKGFRIVLEPQTA